MQSSAKSRAGLPPKRTERSFNRETLELFQGLAVKFVTFSVLWDNYALEIDI
jgi:hypothetical protein